MEVSMNDLRELVGATKLADDAFPMTTGEKYLIRTVTMYYTGEVVSISSFGIKLTKAAWIADTGRFSEALRNGEFNEVEPYINDVVVAKGCIVDFTKWSHDLPQKQK